jgi:putative Mg2+ transporter-C (MgtC) family protein
LHNHLDWIDILLRLALAAIGGTVIGADRGNHGHPAGLRTTLLVCLAATLSMIQANLLLPVAGKAPDSYVVMDVMRLPLGILTGVGFIGAGAILRRDDLVTGITTAATLWFVTVMGLCFGGGQLTLGISACVLGYITLRLLKPLEEAWKQTHQAILSVSTTMNGPSEEQVSEHLKLTGFHAHLQLADIEIPQNLREYKFIVKWRGPAHEFKSPPFITEIAQWPGTLKVQWQV